MSCKKGAFDARDRRGARQLSAVHDPLKNGSYVPKRDVPILPHETVPEASMTAVDQSRDDAERERCFSGLLFFGHRHYCF
jgi:hypothetical protein